MKIDPSIPLAQQQLPARSYTVSEAEIVKAALEVYAHYGAIVPEHVVFLKQEHHRLNAEISTRRYELERAKGRA